jgi:putative drug exporter of the RND superfamily
MLRKLGRVAARRPVWFIGGWAVLLALVWTVGIVLGAQANNNFTLPGASSQEALDELAVSFPQAAGTSATVVYHSTTGANVTSDSTLQSAIQSSVAELSELDGVASVTSPFSNPSLISADGTTALANVLYAEPFSSLPDNGTDAFNALSDSVSPFRSSSLEIELGGSLPGGQPIPVKPILVVYGLIIALVILAIALASWWAFAWPVVGALVGVALGVGLVRILEDFVDVPTISETTAVMIGLGVGIDYGLFVISRTKDFVADGEAPDVAASHALTTIGRAVLTAGATVVVALIALLIFQVPSVSAMAYAVVLVVAAVVLSALTLQPAIVGMVGPRLATSRVPWARRDKAERSKPPMARRWANLVTRHAALMLGAAVLVLLVLAIPVFKGDLHLGPLDNSLFPTSSTQYKAWEVQSSGFGPGSTDPFLLVVQIPPGDSSTQTQLQTLAEDVKNTSGVAAVTPPQLNQSGTTAVMQVIATTDAQDEATSQLVTRLRDDTIPQATAGTGLVASVTGRNAIFVDLDDRIAERLALFIGLVVVVALLILGSVFRSVAVPIKAAILNILVILATYGVLVAFLTYGWGRSLIGIPHDIPVLSLLAPVFFAVLFGLSNDYEVYLVSRMREERQHAGDATEAVQRGLGNGGHVVIAAALIMVFVFASYIFQPGAPVKQFGFGMAVAILLDAFVARMVALPAAMRLGGDAMWWPGRTHSPAAAAEESPEPVAGLTP